MTEIEIKFQVTEDNTLELGLLLQNLTVLSSSEEVVNNRYFDTNQLELRNQGMGLRIRHTDSMTEQTIKCGGKQSVGIHSRAEYNVPLSGAEQEAVPDLSLFPEEIWAVHVLREQIQAKLTMLFSTQFVRKQWLISFEDAEIELAWDRGSISTSSSSAIINEFELELKSGDVTALFSLSHKLAGLKGLRFGTRSKAQRGYELAKAETDGHTPLLTLEYLRLSYKEQIEVGLERWLSHEQEWIASKGLERYLALLKIMEAKTMIGNAAWHARINADWLSTLSAQMNVLSHIQKGDEPSLIAVLLGRDALRLQLAITAWLYQQA